MCNTLTGWYRETCNNLTVIGENNRVDYVSCRLGGSCTQCTPSNFTVDHGEATLNETANTISSCPRLNLDPPQPIKL